MNKKISIYSIILTYVTVIYFTANFSLWSQITSFYSISPNNPSPSAINSFLTYRQDDLPIFYHHPRALIFAPLVTISSITSLKAADLFPLYTCIYLIILFYTQYLTLTSFFKNNKAFLLLTFYILPFYLLLVQFMNGRLIYAFLGFSILNLLISRDNQYSTLKKSLFYLLSAILCSVSSGSFLVYFCTLAIHFYYNRKKGHKNFSILVTFCITLPLLILGVYKNVKYANFSLFNLLKHGWGIKVGCILISLVTLALFVYLLTSKTKYAKTKLDLDFVFIASSLITLPLSALGASILACQIPTHLISLLLLIKKSVPTFSSEDNLESPD